MDHAAWCPPLSDRSHAPAYAPRRPQTQTSAQAPDPPQAQAQAQNQPQNQNQNQNQTRSCRSEVGNSPIPSQPLWMGPVVRHTGTMTEAGNTRVAVYLDFDNIVISRYDQVNGRSSFQRDKAKGLAKHPDRLARATVDVGAIIDFASSFGTLVLTRAYADWSAEVNTGYRAQLVGRAVDLVQLFPAAAYGKNGADIRLAVDAVEDMFRLPDLTHVVIVAGDSDYIPLAQRCKRLGRYVVGIGVAGSTSRALAAACDDFVSYDALPGVPVFEPAPIEAAAEPTRRTRQAKEPAEEEAPDPVDTATALLTRALRIGLEKDDVEWLHNSAVKAQMKRMDPSFSEKALGYKSFSDFLRSYSDLVELDESSTTRKVRLRT